jgi:hypothetical protein
MSAVFVESDVLVASRALQNLDFRSDVSSLPVSSSHFVDTSYLSNAGSRNWVAATQTRSLLSRLDSVDGRYNIRTLSPQRGGK